MILYIDESGDLGFDFTHPKTPQFFVMTAMLCSHQQTALSIAKSVKKTLKNKTFIKKKAKDKGIVELKGSNTTFAVKTYFFRHIKDYNGWNIYTIAFDKIAWLQNNNQKISIEKLDKNTLYDEVAERLLKQINFSLSDDPIYVVIDKSKKHKKIELFDKRVERIIKTLVENKKIPIDIQHRHSQESHELQAVDLFCWGINRKYRYNDQEWYNIFLEKIAVEVLFKS